MELGSKIYELRKNAKLSQEQLAEKLDVTRQTISNWELGQTTPDIFQAKKISNIFCISLDELTDNDMKDILVEKIINTEKLTNTAIKILKFLCIIFICFLIIIIYMTIFSVIKRNNKDSEEQTQCQEYMANTQYKQFYVTVNNEKYSYVIQYGPDYTPRGDVFFMISTTNEETSHTNYETYLNYVQQTYTDCTDVRERIKDLKQYFENNGGTWEEVPYII